MPKKTKKEKILSDRRKKDISIPSGINSVNGHSGNGNLKLEFIPQRIQKEASNTVRTPNLNKDAGEYAYISHGLFRIGLFTFLAIGMQIMLYFLLEGKV